MEQIKFTKTESKKDFMFIKNNIKKQTGKNVSNAKVFEILVESFKNFEPEINKVPRKKEYRIKI